MHVEVSCAPRDSGYGGWLRADLRRRLGSDAVVARVRDPDDVHVVIVGSEPDENTGARSAAAVHAGNRVIPVLLDGAVLPAGLGDLEVVRASDDYWDAMVDRLLERIGNEPPRKWAARLARIPKPRIAVGAVIAAVGVIVGVLTQVGVIGVNPPETGALTLNTIPATDLTQPEYRELFTPPQGIASVPGPADTPGYVFSVQVTLENSDGDRYGIHWTLLNALDRTPMAELRDFRAAQFEPDRANGLHPLWVPCPRIDSVEYVVDFSIVNESHPERPRLARFVSESSTCRLE